MALMRLFVVGVAAARPCAAAAPSRLRTSALPPVVRRAFTQSGHRRYPFPAKKASTGDKTSDDAPLKLEKKAPRGMERSTSPKQATTTGRRAEPMPKVHKSVPQVRTSSPRPPPIEAVPSENLLPETLLIYSPGQARIVYVAFWKVTSLLLGVTCTASMVSGYISTGTIGLSAMAVAICSFLPFALMNYISRPFVTYIFLRLPPTARVSREAVERFIRLRPPADTRLRIMTLGLVARPRVTDVALSELRPAAGRFGLVDFERDVGAAMARRRWYDYLPISRFGVADASHETVKDAWAWKIVRPLLGKTQAERTTPWKPVR